MSTVAQVALSSSADLPRAGRVHPWWMRLDIAAAVLVLTGLNVFLAYWRGTHSFNFSDSSYLLENLHRIHDGELPYRDFFLSLPPVHHYGCAAVWWLFGDQAYYLVIYAAVQQGLIFLLSFLACQQLANRPWASLLASSFVTVGGTAVMGFPLYDTDGGFLFIVIVNLLLWWERRGYGWKLGVVIGILTGLVVLVKLNMGLPLLAGILLSLFMAQVVNYWYSALAGRYSRAGRLFRMVTMPLPFATVGSVAAGAFVCLAAFFAWLSWNDAVLPFVEQNIIFPYRERLHFNETLVETYAVWRSFRRYAGWLHNDCWRFLMIAGTVLCCLRLWPKPGYPPLRRLLLVPTLAFALGTFQSQGYGSTYGIYVVAAILLFELYLALLERRPRLATATLFGVAAGFLVTGQIDLVQGVRLYFLRRPLDDPAPFHVAKLRGLSATRAYRDSFERLARTVQEVIPPEERFSITPAICPFTMSPVEAFR